MENFDFSDFFTTKAQADDFTNRISALSDTLYKTDFHLEKALTKSLGLQKKETFLKLLEENNVNLQSKSNLKAFFNKLIETIPLLPVLSITLAFEPTEKILKIISQWLAINTNKQMLLTITIDHSLLAGAAISFHGKSVDCSIRPTFERILTDTLTNTNKPVQKPAHQNIESLSLGR